MPFNISLSTQTQEITPQGYTCQRDGTRTTIPIIVGSTTGEFNIDSYTTGTSIDKNNINIPNSVKMNPKFKIYNYASKCAPFVYKSVDNVGVNTKNARQTDICLAKYSEAVAEEIDTLGACYTGLKYAFLSAGIIDDYGDMPKGAAKNSLSYFEKNPDKFEKVDVKEEDLKKLPAGYIIVYTKEGTKGHIAVTNGNAQEMSDCTDNMAWIKKHGKGSKATVYKLTDNWQYDKDTKKLKFVQPDT